VSGDDVFFLTAAQLVSPDTDSSLDVYDAHVCSAGSPCVQAPGAQSAPCAEETACKGAGTSAPVYTTPITTSQTGTGNFAPGTHILEPEKKTVKKLTNAQKLAKALKVCRKLKKKAKRHACEKKARKRYPVKKAVKKTAHKPTTAGAVLYRRPS
jgi:hypothetical protein